MEYSHCKLFVIIQAFLFNIRHIVCDNESSNKYTNPKIYWELNWLNQWDEKLILFIKQNLLIPPPSIKGVNLDNAWDSHEPWKYHQGQNGQALLVEHLYELETYSSKKKENLARRQKFYIEAGALDGEFISNTLYLELKHNWTGLLVEPNPDYLGSLINKNRNAWIFPYCLSPKKYPVVVDFDTMHYFSGIINNQNGVSLRPADIIDEKSRTYDKYFDPHIGKNPIWRRKIKVQCFPIYSVLRALGSPIIDYFSLDIEGPEYQVLNTIPFVNSNIRLFGVEVAHAGQIFNGTEEDITNMLSQNGFDHVAKSRFDNFYLKNNFKVLLQKLRKKLRVENSTKILQVY